MKTTSSNRYVSNNVFRQNKGTNINTTIFALRLCSFVCFVKYLYYNDSEPIVLCVYNNSESELNAQLRALFSRPVVESPFRLSTETRSPAISQSLRIPFLGKSQSSFLLLL